MSHILTVAAILDPHHQFRPFYCHYTLPVVNLHDHVISKKHSGKAEQLILASGDMKHAKLLSLCSYKQGQ